MKKQDVRKELLNEIPYLDVVQAEVYCLSKVGLTFRFLCILL